eukprot:TRINITY_DN70993_c1_g1_i1.p12 TRINITY_DN70993_c1_g1~~TRINITY_DN70993_c1_g1_i1.p12  ORF type:complete len:225 (-),score=36.19 TRINITY_DN70993_c1_g1_i1:91-765(-)
MKVRPSRGKVAKVSKLAKKSKGIKKAAKPVKKVKVVKKPVKKIQKKPTRKLVKAVKGKKGVAAKSKAIKKAPLTKKSSLSTKVKVKKPAAVKPKKERKEATYAGYTPDELKKYKELIVENMKLSNDKLKAILRANAQSMSGDKKMLVEKVADGEVLGAMPRCGKCGGGFLKWDNKKGIYWCKGYMDDTVWKNCNFKGGKADVTRSPWVKVQILSQRRYSLIKIL